MANGERRLFTLVGVSKAAGYRCTGNQSGLRMEGKRDSERRETRVFGAGAAISILKLLVTLTDIWDIGRVFGSAKSIFIIICIINITHRRMRGSFTYKENTCN